MREKGRDEKRGGKREEGTANLKVLGVLALLC